MYIIIYTYNHRVVGVNNSERQPLHVWCQMILPQWGGSMGTQDVQYGFHWFSH